MELLLATAVAVLITLFLAAIVNHTGALWQSTRTRTEQFRGARDGFEAMTRRLSQATLNTYWDYYPPGSTSPTSYARQSELRFICGPKLVALAGKSPPPRPSHSIFFQAPVGLVGNTASYGGLDDLLNTWGYYVEFNKELTRPDFITDAVHPPRYRFRLMEMMQPSENSSLYTYTSPTFTSGSPGTSIQNTNYSATSKQWFTDAFTPVPPAVLPPIHVLAENIVALVILPKLAVQEDPANATPLAPNYSYDSTKTDDNNDASVNPAINWKNQLPPVVQVTMIAVDEAGYNRLQVGTTMPNLGIQNLFLKAGDLSNNANPGYAQDLQILQATLQSKHLNYRVFSSNVAIKSAKWSREQTK